MSFQNSAPDIKIIAKFQTNRKHGMVLNASGIIMGNGTVRIIVGANKSILKSTKTNDIKHR